MTEIVGQTVWTLTVCPYEHCSDNFLIGVYTTEAAAKAAWEKYKDDWYDPYEEDFFSEIEPYVVKDKEK